MLPDGITHMRGYVKDPDEAKRYMSLDNGASLEQKDEIDQPDIMEKPEDRRTVDLSKNVLASFIFKTVACPVFLNLIFPPFKQEFSMTNERFIVPEMIFRPADLGLYTDDIFVVHLQVVYWIKILFKFIDTILFCYKSSIISYP